MDKYAMKNLFADIDCHSFPPEQAENCECDRQKLYFLLNQITNIGGKNLGVCKNAIQIVATVFTRFTAIFGVRRHK